MMSGNCQKRFIQRFLAAAAAIFFSFSNFFSSSPALAFVPSPAFLPVVQPVVVGASSGAGIAASLAPPIIIGALAAGAIYYVWSQSQSEQAQNLARSKYCSLFPRDSVCFASSISVEGVYSATCKNRVLHGSLPTPYGFEILDFPDDIYCGGFLQRIYLLNEFGIRERNPIISAYPITKITPLSPLKSFRDWDFQKRKQAFDLLSPSEIGNILQSAPSSQLSENQNLPNGAYLSKPDGSISFLPAPLIVPPPDKELDSDEDGIPDEEEKKIGTNPFNSDSDSDGIPDRKELKMGLNPNNPDTDADGIPDAQDTDANGNDIADGLEIEGDIPDIDIPDECIECEADFQDVPNFVEYAWQKSVDKFPFDILGDFEFLSSGAAASNACPKYSFWGQEYVACEIKNLFSGIKYASWISFIIRMIFSI